MNNLLVLTEYIDQRNGKKRYFDQYGKEHEPMGGMNGLGFLDKFREKMGSAFDKVKTFLKKTGEKVVGVFQPNGDGTIQKVGTGGAFPPQAYTPPPYVSNREAYLFGIDNKTLMIGGILLLGGLWYYKNKR